MYPNALDLVLSFSLSILVIATLIALLFTSLFSCLRRLSHLPEHSTPPPNAGNGDLLPGFPIIIHEPSPQLFPSHSQLPSCSICLGEFGRGEEIRVLPKCSHMFHRVCIDQWLPVRSLHCPVCRACAIEESVEENSDEDAGRVNCSNNRSVIMVNGTVSRSPL